MVVTGPTQHTSVTGRQPNSICETCDPSLPLVIQADERRRTKRSDRVRCDPNGGSGRGSAQEWPLG
jgi:hypothetical protein